MDKHAYPEMYLPDFMECFGNMFQYLERDIRIDLNKFYDMFLQSSIARGIESGNPKYLLGMSGVELAREVIFEKTRVYPNIIDSLYLDRGVAYWVGSVLAHYQWLKNTSFNRINSLGLTIDVIRNMFILHEADVRKFVERADEITGLDRSEGRALAYFRKLKNMSQRELSEASGVPLRMIQLYEQGQNDITRAQVNVLHSLSEALNCEIEDLI